MSKLGEDTGAQRGGHSKAPYPYLATLWTEKTEMREDKGQGLGRQAFNHEVLLWLLERAV